MARLNASDRKAALEVKRAQLDAQLKALEAREKETARKEDTRRKVVAGAIALEHLEKHAKTGWAKEFRDLLDKFVEPRNRHLFAFLATVEPKAPDAQPTPNEKPARGKPATSEAAAEATAPAE